MRAHRLVELDGPYMAWNCSRATGCGCTSG